MPTILQKYCEAALNVLNAQFQTTQVVKHNDTAGTIREQLIKDFLAAHLPALVTIASGQIIDSADGYSKQQDIVLVLKSMPRLPFASGNDLIFIEGVVAAIEVKTRLDGAALSTIGSNLASVRALVPARGSSAQLAPNNNWPQERVLTAAVTYGGMSIESIVAALDNMPDDHRPDLVMDFAQGLLIRNHGFIIPIQRPEAYAYLQNAAEGFKVFLTVLTEVTGTISARAVQWRRYW